MIIRPFLLLLTASTLAFSAWENLWPGEAPGAPRPPAGAEKTAEGARITDIEVPQYQVYLPEEGKGNGAAVVIFAGGGYAYVSMEKEGYGYAEWLAQRGVTGIVVKYRVSDSDALGYHFPVPFLDARRAIRTVRAKAAEWGIDPGRIGVMGSSAGGHLASLCATRFADTYPEEGGDEIDRQSCRPDFAILVYPVISMKELTHGGSRRRLLGENPTAEAIEKYSTERQVGKETPPVFLVTTSDDWVDCRNSLDFAAACKAHQVPVSLHLFEKGGHGYGLHGQGELSLWPVLLENWLKRFNP